MIKVILQTNTRLKCVVFTIQKLLFLSLIGSNFGITYIYNQLIGLVGRVLANGPEDRGSIPGRVIPKTFKNGTWYLLA